MKSAKMPRPLKFRVRRGLRLLQVIPNQQRRRGHGERKSVHEPGGKKLFANRNQRKRNAVCHKYNSSRAKGQNTKIPVVHHCRHRHSGDEGMIPAAVADSIAVSNLAEMAVANVSAQHRRTPAGCAVDQAEDQLAERAAASARGRRRTRPTKGGPPTGGVSSGTWTPWTESWLCG